MTDADVDGAHIRTLLLTFFIRYARPIVDAGIGLCSSTTIIFVLKKVQRKQYVYSEEEKNQVLSELALAGVSVKTKNR